MLHHLYEWSKIDASQNCIQYVYISIYSFSLGFYPVWLTNEQNRSKYKLNMISFIDLGKYCICIWADLKPVMLKKKHRDRELYIFYGLCSHVALMSLHELGRTGCWLVAYFPKLTRWTVKINGSFLWLLLVGGGELQVVTWSLFDWNSEKLVTYQ